jgi:hypothetical protein
LEESDICSRLFLAWAQGMRKSHKAEDKQAILEEENCRKHQT